MRKHILLGNIILSAIYYNSFILKGAFSFCSNALSSRGITSQRFCSKISSHNNGIGATMENIRDISTHYVFLVHGWLGNSKEMEYLRSAIDREASLQKHINSSFKIITYSPTSNDRQTTDGIANGGQRLAEEIVEFIRSKENLRSDSDSDKQDSLRHIGISFVGNSLGGFYSRYCLSVLPNELIIPKKFDDQEGGTVKVILHRSVFATTATPHLGVSAHTYISIPRFMERLIGRCLLSTGKDLFRCDDRDIIYEMGTNYEKFLKPLSEFHRRIAVINAYRTDFQVPTCTAGFFNKSSSYPHYILNQSIDGLEVSPSFIVASVETRPDHNILVSRVESSCKDFIMSMKLDSLGWEKYLIDTRDFIPTPSVSLPSFFGIKSRQKWIDFLAQNENDFVESKNLMELMADSDQFHIPVGHQVMVANSKSAVVSKFTAKGRVVMDYFAKDVVRFLVVHD